MINPDVTLPAITPELMIVSSPWGHVQYRRMIAPGVVLVETASHGGAFVTAEAQAKIPAELRSDDRFYEEDCEIAAVIATWPEYFTAEARAYADRQVASGRGFNFRARRYGRG